MKKPFETIVYVLLGALLVWGFSVSAAGPVPTGVVSFVDEFGRVCTAYEGGLDCDFDPCAVCKWTGSTFVKPTTEIQERLKATSTPEPRDTPVPSATINPTDEPRPTYTPEPTKTPKPHCNKGGGNGSEGCDPGNHPEKGHDDEHDD